MCRLSIECTLAALLGPAALVLAAAEAPAKPIVSVTIDFLDMAFYDRTGPAEYYSLDAYEARIKALAEAGVRRINLRTNVIGLTFYRSKFTHQYGDDYAWHFWEDVPGSKRLIATLKRYDPLTETIRLGHQYGLAVWCWENITDEGGGTRIDAAVVPPQYLAEHRASGGYPLMDPVFRQHPEWWARLKPIDTERVERINREARASPIGRIVLDACRTDRPPIGFGRTDIDLYYSFDNQTYKRYDQDFEFVPERLPDGRNRLTLGGLNLAAPYVKLCPRSEHDPARPYTLAVKGHHDACRAYDIRGKEIATWWGCNMGLPGAGRFPPGYQEWTRLCFDVLPSMAVDYAQYQVGFFTGEIVPDPYLVGVVEFCNREALQHKLDKFGELAAYPFDGCMLSLNCHSDVDDPDRFSYNPAVRERLLAKTGKDVWKDELPIERILEERAAGFAEYIEGCRKLFGRRPFYMHGYRNGGPEYCVRLGRTNMGTLKWPYQRLIQGGAIDGVIMYDDFSDYFTDEITGGRRIALGIYRSIEQHPAQALAELPQLAAIPGLDEIEYYGAVVLNDSPAYLDVIRRFAASQRDGR
jgi:hypothetical protein